MQAIIIKKHAATIETIQLAAEALATPSQAAGECLIQVKAVGVNSSDALATLGYFKDALLPRIPGRDFSGVVVDGDNSFALTSQTSDAGGATGTLGNSPTAGDPTFWLRIKINGTNVAVPAWKA